jgi:Cd2+/Zn2+-exporting ATPase
MDRDDSISNGTSGNPDDTQDQSLCRDVVEEALEHEPGLLRVGVDPVNQEFDLEYDPGLIAPPDVERIARELQPALADRFRTCTLRLQPQGGRACETCALRLEGRVQQIPGVRRATASYRGQTLAVTYDDALVSPREIADQVSGFGVRPATAPAPMEAIPDEAPKPWVRRWLRADRLEAVLTLITLLAMIAGLLVERAGAPAATALYALAYVAGGAFGVKAGLQALRHFTVDVDLLMVLAAIGAWIVGAPFEGAMLLFLFSLSNVLQTYALDRTRNAIRGLMKLRPTRALTRRGGRTLHLPVEQLVVGDVVIVRPGERIPMDGLVVSGESAVDQATITGESIPVERRPGNPVLSGTINQTGGLEVRVTRLADDSTIAKMIRLVEEAQSEKAQTQRFIDRFEQYYALAVILFTIGLIIVPPYIFQEPFGEAFYQAMTVMVAASPCALVISTPASILSAIGNGARRGVLFKGGMHLERAAEIKVVAFDKTGTLTEGRPYVTDVVPVPGMGTASPMQEDELLALAAAVESKSEHPLAQAIVREAGARGLPLPEATGFQADTSLGVRADVNGGQVYLGSVRYFERFPRLDLGAVESLIDRLQEGGATPVLVGQQDGRELALLGVIGVADRLRQDAPRVVAELKATGVERVVMLTGDHEQVARAIARQAGVDEYFAGLMPEEKVQQVREIEARYGPVAMVGDGVNDAPALAAASLGVAMGAAGTDVALETADVVLMADELANIPYFIRLSRRTRRTLMVNLGFALFMIALMLVAIFTTSFSLPLAVIGHEGGTVLVSLNGLRLLFYK